MRYFRTTLVLAGLAVSILAPATIPTAISSGSNQCAEIVRAALVATDRLCEGTGRNQVCYGHNILDAQPQPNVGQLDFTQEGDIVNVDKVQALRLSGMDVASEVWGVALMRLQASLPDSLTGHNITLLVFGDVELENQMTLAPSLDATVQGTHHVNVRQGPSFGTQVIGSLDPGQTVTANGRLADRSWVRIALPDNGGTGWVAGWLLTITAGIDNLDVVEPGAPHYGPMQAFYFQSGAQDAVCQEAPDSGLLIQTPEGVGEVTLLINEVNIQLGSTVYFQAQPGKDMTVRVVEGSARVGAAGKAYRAIAGSQITVPLNENLEPAGPPNPPAAYDMTDVETLPVSNLERPISIEPPATPEAIEATQTPIEIGPDGNPLPPGLSDNPGLGDSVPPGHGGAPPGQDKDKNKDTGNKKDK